MVHAQGRLATGARLRCPEAKCNRLYSVLDSATLFRNVHIVSLTMNPNAYYIIIYKNKVSMCHFLFTSVKQSMKAQRVNRGVLSVFGAIASSGPWPPDSRVF